jgi:hypothetical protein
MNRYNPHAPAKRKAFLEALQDINAVLTEANSTSE